jgi:hypothetical protein
VLEHDASGHGFGFLLTAVPQGFNSDSLPSYLRPGNAFAGQFSTQHEEQTRRSIQWGELLAIAVSVAIYAPFLKDSSVLLKTDNIADVFIIRRQSTSNAELLTLLRCIFATCVRPLVFVTTSISKLSTFQDISIRFQTTCPVLTSTNVVQTSQSTAVHSKHISFTVLPSSLGRRPFYLRPFAGPHH